MFVIPFCWVLDTAITDRVVVADALAFGRVLPITVEVAARDTATIAVARPHRSFDMLSPQSNCRTAATRGPIEARGRMRGNCWKPWLLVQNRGNRPRLSSDCAS
jgi:hypothetical protein